MEYYDTESRDERNSKEDNTIGWLSCYIPKKSKIHVFDFTIKLERVVFAADTQEELED